MRKKLFAHPFYPKLVILVFLVTLLFACKKNLGRDSDALAPLTISEAKATFAESAKKSDELSRISHYVLGFAGRMEKIYNQALWSKSYMVQGFNGNYIITPIEENLTPFPSNTYQASRFLGFFRDKTGKVQMKIVELLSAPGKMLVDNLYETEGKVLTNLVEGRSNEISGLTATILIYDKDYSSDQSFSVTSGQWKKDLVILFNTTQKPIRVKSVQPDGVKVNLYNDEQEQPQSCETEYLVRYAYDMETGEILSASIIATWNVCTTPVTYGSGSGGGTNNTDNNNNTGGPFKLCKNSIQFLGQGTMSSSLSTNLVGLKFTSDAGGPGNYTPGTFVSLNNGITYSAMNRPSSSDYWGDGKTPANYLRSFFSDLFESGDIGQYYEDGFNTYHLTPTAAARIVTFACELAATQVQTAFGPSSANPANQDAWIMFHSVADKIIKTLLPGSTIRQGYSNDAPASYAIYSPFC